ncbi:soma ferritin [Condylostylus longicornis]|uniref:soma ferritin n=1 Tax=Condylostylus longicornis TaxID=2530218 RepID=UPI00244E3527|nr:soma ferritin [Condylostylus longicornis]
MRLLMCIAVLIAAVAAKDECRDNVQLACSQSGSVKCNALYGGFKHAERSLQEYANNQLAASFDYMILASRFNSYQKNRPGFNKLLQGLSDKAWERSIDLIKHIAKRGGEMMFGLDDSNEREDNSNLGRKVLEVDELEALSIALDTEKRLTDKAFHIHRSVSHAHHLKPEDEHYTTGEMKYDPEISQYMEEEFLEYQTDTIRKLSGYTNDLAKLMSVKEPSLSVYLFDEYLAKE